MTETKLGAEEQAILERSMDRVKAIIRPAIETSSSWNVMNDLPLRVDEAALPAPPASPEPSRSRCQLTSQACASCGARIVRTGRNRLSDCGHMRMSGGGWVPREKRPKAPPAAIEAHVSVRIDLGYASFDIMHDIGRDMLDFALDDLVDDVVNGNAESRGEVIRAIFRQLVKAATGGK